MRLFFIDDSSGLRLNNPKLHKPSIGSGKHSNTRKIHTFSSGKHSNTSKIHTFSSGKHSDTRKIHTFNPGYAFTGIHKALI